MNAVARKIIRRTLTAIRTAAQSARTLLADALTVSAETLVRHATRTANYTVDQINKAIELIEDSGIHPLRPGIWLTVSTDGTRAVQSEAIARHSIARLSDAKLAEAWMATNEQPMTVELPIVRGWLMDELEARMGRLDTWADLLLARDFDGGRFDSWLEAESGGYVNPLPYLT